MDRLAPMTSAARAWDLQAESGAAGGVIPEWSLGDRLRKIRRMGGLSQSEFAAKLGQNQKTYASWELDLTAPRNAVAVAKRVEAMSGVPAAWVLGVDAPPPGAPVATERTTPQYRGASSARDGALRLVPPLGEDYRSVVAGYGSSGAVNGDDPYPGVGYGEWRRVPDSARTVNNADAA